MPYFVVFQNFKTNFCLIFLKNVHQQLNMRVHELMRLRAFEVSFGKTSKIIFIPFPLHSPHVSFDLSMTLLCSYPLLTDG